MTSYGLELRTRSAAGGDRLTGLLLCAAGWAGGGVLSAVVFQGSRSGDVTAVDPFVALVAGCLLVGPVAAAVLLWQWKQIRPVSTLAPLTAVGVVAALPVLAGARALISSGQAFAAIVLFVGLWGVVLPVVARAAVVHVEHPWLQDGTPAAGAGGSPQRGGPAAGSGIGPKSPVGSTPAAQASSPTGPPIDDRPPPVRLPNR